jgi:mono/diheme cytochrome c family protein/outer membrane protein assembly factor BamB
MKSISWILRPVVTGALLLALACFASAQAPNCAAAQAEFVSTCGHCHGSNGTGYAPAHTPNFTSTAWQAAHADSELIEAITHGRKPLMPAFQGRLGSGEIRDLVSCVVRRFGQSAPVHANESSPPAIQQETPTVRPPAHVIFGTAGVYTQHNDNARTGANLHETVLTPANVRAGQFGLLFRHAVDDQVFGQPLYVPRLAIGDGLHNVVYVATAANSVYAFDADDGTRPAYWHVHLGPAASVRDYRFGCPDILGNMGIVGTPVIDPATRTLYVVVLTHEHGAFVQRLHALDLNTGAERAGSPVVITAPAFNPILQNQRPALLLSKGSVYIGYASHCDNYRYHGFLMQYDAATLRQQAVFNSSPTGKGASIWQSSQGPAADQSGNVYFNTSNGSWDGVHNFSESFLKLDRHLRLRDWFTPSNHQDLDRHDADINSTGAMLLPGTHFVLGAGKRGVLYRIDTRHMGHLGDEHAAQNFRATVAEVNGGAVVWKSKAKGTLVYLWGQNDHLKAFPFVHDRFVTTPVDISPETSAYPGGILSLSANGGRDGILWANTSVKAKTNSHLPVLGVLRAYDAEDVSHELWNSSQNGTRDICGFMSKNSPPTVVNGHVYLASSGTQKIGSGELCVYGLLP